jgi:hypothetical protein
MSIIPLVIQAVKSKYGIGNKQNAKEYSVGGFNVKWNVFPEDQKNAKGEIK